MKIQILERWQRVPGMQKYRYGMIALSCIAFLGPLAFLPQLVGSKDLCGELCMRRFYLYFPGMSWQDLWMHASVAWIGVIAFFTIITVTFFFGRIWCSFICPVGGMAELGSRAIGERWKIEFRALPQVPIRYGYLAAYMVLLPMLGVSACTLCNFVTVPRFVDALFGGATGIAFLFSVVGLTNLSLLLLMGFFSSKGRAYCQLMCPIGAIDALVNRLGAKLRLTYHIRVERSRCTGCNECAKACMCGAIKMVDRIATVDQTSCMSCHDCVDVCEWNAIEWTPGPRKKQPKRIKRGIEIYPEPQWEAFAPASTGSANWPRVINGLIISGMIFFIAVTAWVKL